MLILRPIWSVIVIQNLNYSLSYIHWFLKILGKLRRFSRYDDEISEGQLGINEKELNSMNKHIPGKNFELYFACSKNIFNNIIYATILCTFQYLIFSALKSHGKSATFRQHYYPEGGWGWVITFCCYMVNIFTTGLQMSFGIILPEIVSHCQKSEQTPSTSRVDVGKI